MTVGFSKTVRMMGAFRPNLCWFAGFIHFIWAGVKAVIKTPVQSKDQHQPQWTETLLLKV